MTDIEAELYDFTRATVLPADGARVALISCLKCGAALVLDPREKVSVVDRHRAWHDAER